MIEILFFTFLCLTFSQEDINSTSPAIPNAIAKATVEDFHVMVLGSEYTPRYTFWLGSKPDQVYSVSIRQFFELIGMDEKVEESEILPLVWEYSSVGESPNGYFFTLTHYAPSTHVHRYRSVVIRNWIARGNSTNSTCPLEICLQFDITLDGYKWIRNDSSLVLAYWLTSSDVSASLIHTSPGFIEYGIATIKISRNATGYSEDGIRQVTQRIPTHLVDPNHWGESWVKYDHFRGGGRMNHQGSMGFSGTNTFLDREIYFRIRINDIMVFICLFVLFIALTLGGIWAYNRYQKKNDYIEIH